MLCSRPLALLRPGFLVPLAFVALAAIALPPRAQAQIWTPMAPFNGGNWTACAAGPAGEMFVIYDAGTLHRSTNQGASWTNITPDGVDKVTAVRPVSGTTVVAGAGYPTGPDNPDDSWLDVSPDDGASWTQVQESSTLGDPFVALSTDGASTIFAVTRSGSVWESTDTGASWNQTGTMPLPGGAMVHDLLFDSIVDPKVLLAATDAGLYSSPDGTTWSHVSLSPPGVLHVVKGTRGNYYLSTASATYEMFDGIVPIGGAGGGSLCVLSDGSLLIGGAYKYASGVLTPLPSPLIGTTNQVAVISGSALLAATSEGVLTSSNNAQSWSDVAPVIAALQQTMIGSLGPSGAVAVVGDAAYATQTPGSAMVRTTLFGPTKPFVAVGTPDGAFAATHVAGVFQSTDFGASWTATTHDFATTTVTSMVRMANGTIVVGTTTDGGPFWSGGDNTWTQSGGGLLGFEGVTALATVGTTVVVAASSGSSTDFFVSTDLTQDFSQVSSGAIQGQVTQLAAASTSLLYALSGGVLYRSIDGGHSWAQLPSISGVQSMLVDGRGNIWITLPFTPSVAVSTDQGANWSAEDAGTSGVTSLALAPSQDLYAGGVGGWHSTPATNCFTSGMVAWWPAEGNANDMSGNSHNGTLQNGATFASGKMGMAFSLDGVNDNVSVPDSPPFHFSGAMSIEGWINTTAGTDRYIATKHEDSFYFAVGGGAVAPHKLSIWLNGVTTSWFTGSTTVDDGQWHHVAATYDGSNLKLYVDGLLDASAPRTGTIQSGLFGILIGARSDGTNASNFPGMIDELAVFNRALGATEIQSIAAMNEPCSAVSVSDAPGLPTKLELAAPWPNPASRIMNFEFRTPSNGVASAEIVDVAGRRVSQPLKDQVLPGGTHRFQWDGLDSSGRRAVAGVYFIRVRSGAASAVQRVVLVR